MDVKVFDADKIDDQSFEDFKKPLTESEILNNIQQLEKTFSERKRLEELKIILK